MHFFVCSTFIINELNKTLVAVFYLPIAAPHCGYRRAFVAGRVANLFTLLFLWGKNYFRY